MCVVEWRAHNVSFLFRFLVPLTKPPRLIDTALMMSAVLEKLRSTKKHWSSNRGKKGLTQSVAFPPSPVYGSGDPKLDRLAVRELLGVGKLKSSRRHSKTSDTLSMQRQDTSSLEDATSLGLNIDTSDASSAEPDKLLVLADKVAANR